MPNPAKNLSYREAIAELEQIVTDLDQGVIDVDVLGERFQRVIDIVEELDGRIRRTRAKVDELVPRLEAIGGMRTKDASEQTAENSY